MRTLLWLDDLRSPFEQDWMNWLAQYSPIEQPYEVVWVKSYEQFVDWIKKNELPDGIAWDYDLGSDIAREKVKNGMSKTQARKEKRGTKNGLQCAKWLIEYCRENKFELPPYVMQSANEDGKKLIDELLKSFIKHQ